MTPIESEIWTSFLERLASSDQVDERLLQDLKDAFSRSKLPKAEDLVQLFITASGGVLA